MKSIGCGILSVKRPLGVTVEPQFERLNGEDPRAFIVSANIARRNLTQGQQMMALAMIYPEPTTLKRKGSRSFKLKEQVSEARLSQARTVLQYAPELVPQIMASAKPVPFITAYEEAQKRKATSDAIETKMVELRGDAPDLARLVAEERLSLPEAYSTLEKRRADAAAAEANKRETLLRLTEHAVRGATAWSRRAG
jgi:hypothetical protein